MADYTGQVPRLEVLKPGDKIFYGNGVTFQDPNIQALYSQGVVEPIKYGKYGDVGVKVMAPYIKPNTAVIPNTSSPPGWGINEQTGNYERLTPRATGGIVQPGEASIVGENGPELALLPPGTNVIPKWGTDFSGLGTDFPGVYGWKPKTGTTTSTAAPSIGGAVAPAGGAPAAAGDYKSNPMTTYRDPATGAIYDFQGNHIASLADYQQGVAGGKYSGSPMDISQSPWYKAPAGATGTVAGALAGVPGTEASAKMSESGTTPGETTPGPNFLDALNAKPSEMLTEFLSGTKEREKELFDAYEQQRLDEIAKVEQTAKKAIQSTKDISGRAMGSLKRVLGRAGGFTTSAGGMAIVNEETKLTNSINELYGAQQQAINEINSAYRTKNAEAAQKGWENLFKVQSEIENNRQQQIANYLSALEMVEKQRQFDVGEKRAGYEFNIETALKEAGLTGDYKGDKTLEARVADAELALKEKGLELDKDTLDEQIRQFNLNYALDQAKFASKAVSGLGKDKQAEVMNAAWSILNENASLSNYDESLRIAISDSMSEIKANQAYYTAIKAGNNLEDIKDSMIAAGFTKEQVNTAAFNNSDLTKKSSGASSKKEGESWFDKFLRGMTYNRETQAMEF